MKKFFVAMMALCAMAVSFTSCEKNADPAKEPIAGKTFFAEEDGQSVKFTFLMNHKAINEMVTLGQTVRQDNLTWEMNANAKDFNIKWGAGMVDSRTGEPVGGMILYKGVYDAEKSQITVTMQGTQEQIVFVCQEVK